MIEFQPLGGMHRHDRDGFFIVCRVIIHDEAYMFEEITERFILFHRSGKFGEVFEPSGAFGGTLLLQHVIIAGFFEYHPQ